MSNQLAFTLLEATLTLYLENADGSRGAAIWSGAPAENFSQAERWLNVETRATGARHPRNHPLVAQYQIAIERVWALPLANLIGFQPTEQRLILEVIWTEEELQRWHRRVYYGVTISARSLRSRDIESGHQDDQEFLAEYFVPDSGNNSTVPAPVTSTPAFVIHRGANGISTVIYSYAAGVFTKLSDGSLATIAADGSTIQFGTDDPVVVTSADGLTVPTLHDSFPTALPRLEFYSGSLLVAAVTADGLWARSYADDYTGGGGLFLLSYQTEAVAAFNAGVVSAAGYTALD